MSKKYKNKTCVYCGVSGASETRDHVLARQFVLERQRQELPAVPACKACNSRKAKLENTLTAILPFGGRHPDATENLTSLVPKRLQANAALGAELRRSYTTIWVQEGPSGLLQRAGILPLEAGQIESWIGFITLGLIWHHWKVIAGGQVDVEPMLLTRDGEELYGPLFDRKGVRRVPVTSIGGDALVYEGIADATNPLASLWRFAIYGGLQLAGDDPSQPASTFYVTVRPRSRQRGGIAHSKPASI